MTNGINQYDSIVSVTRTYVDAYAYVGSSVYYCRSSEKTSPKFLRMYDDGRWLATKHGEMGVLGKLPAGVNPTRVKIFTVRKTGGILSNSRPCRFCQLMMESFGILPRNIHYYDWHGNIKKLNNWTYHELKEEYVENSNRY